MNVKASMAATSQVEGNDTNLPVRHQVSFFWIFVSFVNYCIINSSNSWPPPSESPRTYLYISLYVPYFAVC